MKTLKHGIIGIIAIIALAFGACPNETQPKTYTVSFDADNGTEAVTQTVTEGGKAVKPSVPEKDGYNFDHWFNTADNAEWDFDTVVTADLSLKAKWTQIPPEPAPWNGSVSVTCSGLVESGQTLTVNITVGNGTGDRSIQWTKDGAPVPGENAETYALTDADIGASIGVTVSYSGNTGEKSVEAAAAVEKMTLADGGVTISGEMKSGETLTANITAGNGTGARTVAWSKSKDDVTANIGENDINYTLEDTDIGFIITVVVTYANNRGSFTQTANEEVIGIPITRTITVPDEKRPNGGLEGQKVTIEIPYDVVQNLNQFFEQYSLSDLYETQEKQIGHIVEKLDQAFIHADNTLVGFGGDSDKCNTVLERNLKIIIKESLSSGWSSVDNWNTISFRIGGTSGGLLARTDTVVGNTLINAMVIDMYGMDE